MWTTTQISNKYQNWHLYLFFVALLSVPAYTLLLDNGIDSSATFLVMFVPTAAVLCMKLWRGGSVFQVGWKLKPVLFLLLAALLPPILELGKVLLAQGFNMASIAPDWLVLQDGAYQLRGFSLLWGHESGSLLFLLFNFIVTLLVGVLVYAPFALAEEFGWRGYLQPRLTKRYGSLTGMLLLGVIWGWWHAPAILAGHNFPEMPYLGAFVLMPIGTMAMSVVFGYLYKASGSIWVPVLGHSALNISTSISNNLLGVASDQINVTLVWLGLWVVTAVLTVAYYEKFNKSDEIIPALILSR